VTNSKNVPSIIDGIKKIFPNPSFLFFWVFLVFITAKKNGLFIDQITWGVSHSEKNAIVFFSLASSLFLWFLPVLFRKKSLFIFIGAAQFIWYLVGLWFFLYFHRYPAFSMAVQLLGQISDLVTTKSLPYYPALWITAIDIPFFLACFFLMDKNRLQQSRKLFITSVIGIIFVFTALGTFWYFNGFNPNTFKEDLKYFGDSAYVKRYGLLTWQINQVFKKKPVLHYSKNIVSSTGKQKHRNVILIQVESLDAGAVRMHWNGKPIMPYLEKLSQTSLYYPAVMSFHKGGGTSDAELSLINSVDPFSDRPTIMDNSIIYSNSFVWRLRKAGYQTLAFHGNTGKFWNRSLAFPAMGYSNFYDTSAMALPQSGWGIPDHKMFDYVLGKLKKVQQEKNPFFCHIITMSTHEPYNITSKYHTNKDYDTVPDVLTARFFTAMNYLDTCLERIIPQFLDFPDTDIFIIGDHASIEMDCFSPSRIKNDSILLDFVPFFYVSLDHPIQEERSVAGSFMDLAVTILESAGIPYSIRSDGKDLRKKVFGTDSLTQDNLSWTRSNLYKIWQTRPIPACWSAQ